MRKVCTVRPSPTILRKDVNEYYPLKKMSA